MEFEFKILFKVRLIEENEMKNKYLNESGILEGKIHTQFFVIFLSSTLINNLLN